MTKHEAAAIRSQRAYLKRKHTAQAEMAGAEILDLTIAARAHDGHYVIRLHDGTDLHLIDRPTEADAPVEAKPATRVYVPKSWDGGAWNRNLERMRDMTKEQAITELDKAAEGKDGDAAKKLRHAKAVIEAMPDTPDWVSHMPVFTEGES